MTARKIATPGSRRPVGVGEEPGRRCREWLLGRALLVIVIALCCAAATPLGAQPLLNATSPAAAEAEATPDPTSRAQVSTRLDEVRRELEGARPLEGQSGDDRSDHVAQVYGQRTKIAELLGRQLETIDRLEAPPRTEVSSVEAEESSIFSLNALYELRRVRQSQEGRRLDAVGQARAALESAKERLDSAERARRKASQASKDATGEKRVAAARALELALLASRAAAEHVHLQTLELRLAQRRSESAGDGPDLSSRIDSLRARLAQKEGDSTEGFANLTRRDAELRGILEASARRLSTIELRLSAAQNRYAQQPDPSSATLVEVEALTARRDAVRQEIGFLEGQIERIAAQRELWSAWSRLIASEVSRSETEEVSAYASGIVSSRSELDLRLQGRMTELQIGLDSIETRLADDSLGARAKAALEEQRIAFERLLGRQRAEISSLAMERRVAERVLDEVDLQFGQIDVREQLARVAQSARDLWAYEIAVVDDSPITVGSLVLAIFLLGIGLWASRRGAMIVGRLATARLSLDPGAATALQTLSFYLLLVSFGLLALRVVHFPLTAFTVLGGALAIGIGFGSQNVMNNFISGLILMLERPVRAHDLVEIDGMPGTIERIGARSTQIRATDGRFIIVPNSFFLESNVVNWTLSDDLIRTKVAVGVVYGSPTRLVEDLIHRVVTEESQILPEPAPIIIFDEFGDNSLNFEVHFWIVARSPMATRRVASALRFRIDELFREHGLVIAFPQRDVHLDSVSPIEVRLMGSDAETGGTSAR